jgi:hypothetical protein
LKEWRGVAEDDFGVLGKSGGYRSI